MSDGRMIFDTLLDMTGIKKGLEKIKNISADELKGAGTVFEQTGGKLTKYITKPALGAAAALTGLSLIKGFNRLKNIDTAKAQLEGLGHSAKEVESIMDSAMQAVKGTAYGFDEAATAAASAVAAGIKPGQELTRYLGLVGDAAAQSKLSFTEMGSIFNKVMASGKISMEEVNQLADQGIPIYKMLSEQLGVTQADVRDMVSAGKVDAETFLAAIEKNIGGAAKIIGEKSFTGALANIGASLGRIGANFLDAGGKGGGFFSQLKPLMVDFMETLGKVEDKAADFGEKFGAIFAKVVNFIKAVPVPVAAIGSAIAVSAGPLLQLTGKLLTTGGAIKAFRAEQEGMSLLAGIANGKLTVQQAILIKLSSGLKSAATGIGSFVSNMARKITATAADTAATTANTAATAANGIASGSAAQKVLAFASAHKIALAASLGLAAGIAALAIYMIKTGASADDIANKITAFADKAASMITSFADNLPAMLDAVIPALTQTILHVASLLPTLLPQLIDAFVSLLSSLVNALTQIIGPVTNALVQAVVAIIAVLPTLIPQLIQAAITLFMALVDAIPTVIDALIEALPQILDAILGVLPELIPALIDGAVQLLMAFVLALPQVINALLEALPRIIEAIVEMVPVLIPALIDGAVQLFMAFVQAIPQIIVAIVQALPQIIEAIVSGLLSMAGQLFSTGIQLLKRLWEGIRSWAGSLGSKVRSLAASLPGKIKSGLGSLWSVGSDFIAGLWNGIKAKFDSVVDKVSSLAGKLPKAVKKVLGIASPSRVMKEVGKFFTEGLDIGMMANTKQLIADARAQAEDLKSAYSGTLSGSVAAKIGSRFTATVAQAAPVAVEPSNIEQVFNFYQPFEDPIAVARRLKQQAMYGLAGDR